MTKIKLGTPLIHLKTVDSTNNYALQLIQDKHATPGTVILADYQTHGKGQGDNHWESDTLRNLLFSVVLKPDFLPASRQFYLSMAVSIALAGFLKQFTNTIKIKWPNDIYVGDNKISGILIENTIMGNFLHHSVVGIGLNVNQVHFPEGLSATSLYRITSIEYNLTELLYQLLDMLSTQLEILAEPNLSKIRTEYLNNLYLLNEWHTFADAEGSYAGRIVDLDESGQLIIHGRNGSIKKYGFREVRF